MSPKGRECGQERELLEEESEAPFFRGRIQGLEGAMMGRYISLLECITNYHNLGAVSKNSGSWKSEIKVSKCWFLLRVVKENLLMLRF